MFFCYWMTLGSASARGSLIPSNAITDPFGTAIVDPFGTIVISPV